MPILATSPLAASPPPSDVASEDELAACLGRFLHVCPGLNKVAIGELLGEPDPFYLKVRVWGSRLWLCEGKEGQGARPGPPHPCTCAWDKKIVAIGELLPVLPQGVLGSWRLLVAAVTVGVVV